MNKILKRIVNVGVGAILLVAGFMPLLKVHAIENPEDYVAIRMRGATGMSEDGDNYIFTYEGGTVSVAGNGELAADEIDWNYGDHMGRMWAVYTKGDTLDFAATPVSGSQVQASVNINGERDPIQLINNSYRWGGLTVGDGVVREIEFEFGGGNGGEPEPQGNTEAILRVRGGEGSFDDSIYDDDGELVEERIVAYADTYTEGSFAIDGGWFTQPMPEDVREGGYSELTYRYDDDGDGEVDLGFATLWHMRYMDKIVVNGQEYDIPMDYSNQASYLEHYDGQVVSFVITVPKAEDNVYDITVKIGKSEYAWIGNFLWTADPGQEWEVARDEDGRLLQDEDGNYIYVLDEDGERRPNYNYIGHSKIELVAVSYSLGGGTYSCNVDTDECTISDDETGEIGAGCQISLDDECANYTLRYVEFDSGNEEYDDGSLVVPAGATVTMRIIPDYGYQIMNVDMMNLVVDDKGVGEFTFTVPGGAAYFVADVVPMEDTVSANSELVASGAIELGDEQTTLEHGTAKLEVNDVELSDEDKAAFAEASGDYDIKHYLDISLFNVVCKGAAECTGSDDDSWSNQVKDLNEPATITLQLEEGVDGNEIVIVHQKHDGTYEVIPVEYDPEAHTITFTTTSFSNYAIAARTTNSPETGQLTIDESASASEGNMGIVIAAVAVGVVIAGGVAVIAMRHQRRKSQEQ